MLLLLFHNIGHKVQQQQEQFSYTSHKAFAHTNRVQKIRALEVKRISLHQSVFIILKMKKKRKEIKDRGGINRGINDIMMMINQDRNQMKLIIQ